MVPCRQFDSVNDETYIALLHKPRDCVFGGQYSYNSAYVKRIRWRSYGGRTTHGSGILRANMGYRARVRFMLYRPRRWEESAYWYTRLRGRNLREGITFRMRLRIY